MRYQPRLSGLGVGFFDLIFKIDEPQPLIREMCWVRRSDRPAFSDAGQYQTLGERDANPLALLFLTESLILAQNERWRRG